MNNLSGLIFIIDDNSIYTKFLYHLLCGYGYSVVVAKSGETALKQLQSLTPDLILLDVVMPGIDGFEICHQLKNLPKLKNVPIIFISFLSDAENKIKGLNLGAVDYITKPFEHQEVLVRINTHIKSYQLQQKLEKRIQERAQELNDVLEGLKQSKLNLAQSEKMSTIGNLE